MDNPFPHIETIVNERDISITIEEENLSNTINNEAAKSLTNIHADHFDKKGVHKCEKCGKLYKSKENKILHYKNVHLGQKPYKCNYCSSRFSHRNGKIYHERRFHTKIFPYPCPFISECNAAFPTKSSLRYHIRTKHKLKVTLNYNDQQSDNNTL